MQIISAIMFALSANLDCLAIGLSYGIRSIEINHKNNFLLASISSIGTFLSMTLGTYITGILDVKWISMIGCMMIIMTGLFLIFQYLKENKNKKQVKSLEDYDVDHSGTINGKEVLALSLGLSANNAGVGIGASIAGIPLELSCVLTFFMSAIFIYISTRFGKSLRSKYTGGCVTLLSGILLIFLGIYEIFV